MACFTGISKCGVSDNRKIVNRRLVRVGCRTQTERRTVVSVLFLSAYRVFTFLHFMELLHFNSMDLVLRHGRIFDESK